MLSSMTPTIVVKDGKQVTFRGVTSDGIEVTKTYRVTEGKGSDEHLLALTLTLKNTGAAPCLRTASACFLA